jgi:hypothetical protein
MMKIKVKLDAAEIDVLGDWLGMVYHGLETDERLKNAKLNLEFDVSDSGKVTDWKPSFRLACGGRLRIHKPGDTPGRQRGREAEEDPKKACSEFRIPRLETR